MSDEIKSIRDLKPLNSVPVNEEVVEDIVEETEVENEEVVETVNNDRPELEYVSPDEDTTFGTGFDFGQSINRRRGLITEKVRAIQEEVLDEEIEKDISDEDDYSEDDVENISFDDDEDFDFEGDEEDHAPAPKKETKAIKEEVKPKKAKVVNIKEVQQDSLFMDDEDFSDIDDMDDNSETAEEEDELAGLKLSITSKLQTVEKELDVTGFTVAKTPISVNNILRESVDEDTFDWALMSSGNPVAMKSFSGTEIEDLAGGNSRNRLNNMKTVYRTIYNHIVAVDKPSFESWLRATSFMDIPHLYMAIYKASFNNANYIPYTCSNNKCNHIFLSDDVDIMEMVKFKDDIAEEKFNTILNDSGIVSPVYETRIVPITNKIAIGFREPSIYNTIFENVILDQKFVDKYEALLGIMVYIDDIYYIKDGQFVPTALKKDVGNLAKTTKYRISAYTKIINTLPSDSFIKIRSIIANINDLGEEVQYQLPEVICPKCSHHIAAMTGEPEEMLFNRHQLVAIANS